MSFNNLKRDVTKILEKITVTPTGQEVAKEDLYIYVPEHFKNINLVRIAKRVEVYGCHAIVSRDGFYAVRNVNAFYPINPRVTKVVTLNGVKYLEFFFPAGTVMVTTTTLVKEDTLIYFFVNEIYFNGKLPAYLNDSDVIKLLDSAAESAGSNVGKNRKLQQLLAAYLSRDPKNIQRELRFAIHDGTYKPGDPFRWTGLKNVFTAAKGALNKTVGAYLDDGIVSALNTRDGVVTPVEKILRA